jgi:hypothetical protein
MNRMAIPGTLILLALAFSSSADEALKELIGKNQPRKTAMFWLGQSRDSRALDFIEQVLSR